LGVASKGGRDNTSTFLPKWDAQSGHALSEEFRWLLLWLLGGTVAFLMAVNWLPAAYVHGEFIPWGNDSFYHARRILDAVQDPSAFYEFDPRIHAPEGSWLTWPWAYDLGVAYLVREISALLGERDPARILMFVPTVWVYVNAALLLALGTSLALSWPSRVLLMLCFALSPLTQGLHGVGRIDHHFLEYSFVLGSAWLAVAWANRPESATRASTLGMWLGAGPAFQNGLFILQLPVVASFCLLWVRGRGPRPAPAAAFAGALMAATLVVLLPSGPFRENFFAFYLLSWFHLYVACSTALVVALISRWPFSGYRLLVLAAFCIILAFPLIHEVRHGYEFLTARLLELNEMPETRTILGQTGAARLTVYQAVALYSGLVFLVPATLAWAGLQLLRGTAAGRIVFSVFVLFGLAMLLQQERLHYFGSFAIYVPVLLVAGSAIDRLGRTRPLWYAGFALLVVAAYVPGIPVLFHPTPMGGDPNYALIRPVFPPLAEACRREPGVVLADHNLGNLLRYHTDCSVIANNMIMTAQHVQKILQADALLASTPQRIRHEAPWIRYLVVISNPKYSDALKDALLFGDGPFPEGYERITRVTVSRKGTVYPIVAAFKIDPPG
jgi:hypothetical protein